MLIKKRRVIKKRIKRTIVKHPASRTPRATVNRTPKAIKRRRVKRKPRVHVANIPPKRKLLRVGLPQSAPSRDIRRDIDDGGWRSY